MIGFEKPTCRYKSAPRRAHRRFSVKRGEADICQQIHTQKIFRPPCLTSQQALIHLNYGRSSRIADSDPCNRFQIGGSAGTCYGV